MWNRAELKSKAKIFLKANLLVSILVCLFFAFATGLFGNQSYLESASDVAENKYDEAVRTGNFTEYDKFLKNTNFKNQDGKVPYYFYLYESDMSITDQNLLTEKLFNKQASENDLSSFLLGGGYKVYLNPVTAGIIIIISLLAKVFILNPLTIGYRRFFIKGAKNIDAENKFSTLFSSFKDGTWFSLSIKLAIKNIYLALWSLLFVIPGIYKSYQYYYVDYILAENPELSIGEAINISKEMTHQDKLNIFVLNLSFIGWEILSWVLLGLGFIILNPYKESTYANLYLSVKENNENVLDI